MKDFIGRKRELDRISQFYNDSQDKLLLVIGDSGLGKTRLLKEFAKNEPESHWIFFFNVEPYESPNIYLYQWMLDIQSGKGFFKGRKVWEKIVEKEPKIIDFTNLSLESIKIGMEVRFVDLLTRLASLENSKKSLTIIIDPVIDIKDKSLFNTAKSIAKRASSRVKIILTRSHKDPFINNEEEFLNCDGVSILFLSRFSEEESREKLIEANIFDKGEAPHVEKLIKKSDGSPLYMECCAGLLRHEIKAGKKIDPTIDDLPDSLPEAMFKLYKDIQLNDEREIVHWLSLAADGIDFDILSFLTSFPMGNIISSLKGEGLRLALSTGNSTFTDLHNREALLGVNESGNVIGRLHPSLSETVRKKLIEGGEDLGDRYKWLAAYYLKKLIDHKEDFEALRLYHLYLLLSEDQAAYIKAAAELVERFYAFGLHEGCIEIMERVITYNKGLGRDKREYVEFISKCGIICHEQRHIDKAIDLLNEAIAINREINDKEGEAAALGNIGIVFRDTFEADKAIKCFKDSLDIYKTINNKLGEAHILTQIWLMYYKIDALEKAIEYLSKLMTVTKEMGDIEKMPSISGNIGNLYCAIGNFDKAVVHYEQALDISRKIGNHRKEASYLSRIGIAYLYNGLQIEALEYFSNSLKIYIELGDKHGEATQYGNIGIVYKNMKAFDNALANFGRALELFTKGRSARHIALIKRNIMNVKRMMNEKKE